jgi:hypothetical protein
LFEFLIWLEYRTYIEKVKKELNRAFRLFFKSLMLGKRAGKSRIEGIPNMFPAILVNGSETIVSFLHTRQFYAHE